MISILMLAGGVMCVIVGKVLDYAASLDSFFAGWNYAAYVIAAVMGVLAVANFIAAVVQLKCGHGVKRRTPQHRRRK